MRIRGGAEEPGRGDNFAQLVGRQRLACVYVYVVGHDINLMAEDS